MATAALDTINNLDNLLDDLSNARINVNHEMSSSMVSERTFVTSTSSSTIEQSNWEYVRPKSRPADTLNLAGSLARSTSSTTATAVTNDLDDLNQTLRTDKLKPTVTDHPADTDVEILPDDIVEAFAKELNTADLTSIGNCYVCDKSIFGQAVAALGRVYRPEHFTCANCNQELKADGYKEKDGQVYCEACFNDLFTLKCGGCGKAFDDDEGFQEKDDKAYCDKCFYRLFATKCAGCSLPITENYISSMDAQWHPGCFVCKECKQPFADGNFYEADGFPYCETHFHALRGSLCAGCNKVISGRCITAMFRKFHPEHFVCSFCLKQLNKGTFKENGDKPYCHECYDRLFR